MTGGRWGAAGCGGCGGRCGRRLGILGGNVADRCQRGGAKVGADAGVTRERAAAGVRLEGHLRQAKRAATALAFCLSGGAPQSIQNGDSTVDEVAGPAGGGGRVGGGRGDCGRGDGGRGCHGDGCCGAGVERRRERRRLVAPLGRPVAVDERRGGGCGGDERVAKRRPSAATATARVAGASRGVLDDVAAATASVEAGPPPRHSEQATQFAVDAAVAVREYERRDDGVGAERQDAHLLDVVRQAEVGEQQRRAGDQHESEGQPAEERHHDDEDGDAGGARLLAVPEHAGVGDAVAQRVDDGAGRALEAALGRRVVQRLRRTVAARRRRGAPRRRLRRSPRTAVLGVVELDVLADRGGRPTDKIVTFGYKRIKKRRFVVLVAYVLKS